MASRLASVVNYSTSRHDTITLNDDHRWSKRWSTTTLYAHHHRRRVSECHQLERDVVVERACVTVSSRRRRACLARRERNLRHLRDRRPGVERIRDLP